MDSLASDLRVAARSLLKRPGFTVVALLTLALGIGANSAIFSVVHAALLRPLPYPDEERLVQVWTRHPGFDAEISSGGDYLVWRDGSKSFQSIGAYSTSGFTLLGREQAERIQGARVSASFLPTLGVRSAQGRGFVPHEEQGEGAPVAVVSQRLWQRLFGAGARLGGQSLRLDEGVYSIVGVLPRGFVFPGEPEVEVLLPLALDIPQELARRQMSMARVTGRLKPEVTMDRVRAELQAIHSQAVARADERPPGMPESQVQVETLREWLVGDLRPALLVLAGAVGFVLLIACANVANLLLARATARRQEMAIRSVLGAGRRQIARLLLTESALLGLLGGACGLLLALAAIRPLVALIPAEFAGGLFQQIEIGIDAPVLAFTLLVSLGTGLLFGLAPALSVAGTDLQDPIKEKGRGRSGFTRRLLVAAEVALAVVLLVGAGLLLRSFLRLQAVDPGFDPEGLLTVAVDLPDRYQEPAQRALFFQEAARRIAALPGVETVSFSDSLPPSGRTMLIRGMTVDGREPRPGDDLQVVSIGAAGPGYFQTLGIPLLRGRSITARDVAGATRVAVVSRSFARHFWGKEEVIGRQFETPQGQTTVVGVAMDVHQFGQGQAPGLHLYRAFLQDPLPFARLAVRTRTAPETLAASLRREILEIDGGIPLHDIATMEERLAESVAERRFHLLLLGLFALVALALSGVGLYGVLAYAVTERTQEIGVRLALGAQRGGVLALVVRQGLTMAAAGIAVGLPASVAAARLLSGSLFGIPAADPLTLAAIPLLLLAVALLSSWLPARRATRVSPMVALRND